MGVGLTAHRDVRDLGDAKADAAICAARTGFRLRRASCASSQASIGAPANLVSYNWSMRLADVERVHIGPHIIPQTEEVLRKYGEQGCEGLVLWAGVVDGQTAIVQQIIVPQQNAIRDETGVGYFVEGPILFKLSKHLEKEKLRLIAQVHSHPTEAYHSETDDRYAIVTENGGFSLVVPDFARRPMTLAECAIYRLRRGGWDELSAVEVNAALRLE